MKKQLVIAVFALTAMLIAGMAYAAQTVEIELKVGESTIIDCRELTRTAIGDPLVADVAPVSTDELLVNGKMPGKTVLHVWDESGRKVYRITVRPVEVDMEKLRKSIEQEINDPRITVLGVENTIILEGVVSREAESSRIEAIARAVAESAAFHGTYGQATSQEAKSVARPDGESFVVERVVETRDGEVGVRTGLRLPKVVNLIRIERNPDEVSIECLEAATSLRQGLNDPRLAVRALPGNRVMIQGRVGTGKDVEQIDRIVKGWEQDGIVFIQDVLIDTALARQVMVRAQIVDIDKTALKEFGVDWGRVIFEQSNIPDVVSARVEDQPWLIGQTNFGPFDIFGGGRISRIDPVGARIRALQEQNKAKVLSEPNLLVLDQEEASILVGGEIPVPVVQTAQIGGAASVSVQYKEFGVRLNITPIVSGEDTVQLRVIPEVSSLDFANAVVMSGFRIPALRTRRAETTVSVRDGQSLIIGGLLQNETSRLVRQIPVLGDLPIIGELFKTRSFVEGETELVIIVTPQIVSTVANLEQ